MHIAHGNKESLPDQLISFLRTCAFRRFTGQLLLTCVMWDEPYRIHAEESADQLLPFMHMHIGSLPGSWKKSPRIPSFFICFFLRCRLTSMLSSLLSRMRKVAAVSTRLYFFMKFFVDLNRFLLFKGTVE